MRSLLAVAVALVALVVLACGDGGLPTTEPTPDPVPVDPAGPWVLTSGVADGQPIPMVEGARITFSVDGSNVSGQSACNQYFGQIAVVGGRVTLSGLGGTEMACEEPVMASEAAYLKALGAITNSSMDGETLVLFGPGVELRFERLEPPPTAEIVGTHWILDSLVQGDAVASTIGEPATLMLNEDGSLEGSTGCRRLSGRYVVSGDEIDFAEFSADGECAGGPADQDAHVIDVLEGGFRATVDGQQLTLTGDGGLGLVYRVAAE